VRGFVLIAQPQICGAVTPDRCVELLSTVLSSLLNLSRPGVAVMAVKTRTREWFQLGSVSTL
jgi:hypothetical protein